MCASGCRSAMSGRHRIRWCWSLIWTAASIDRVALAKAPLEGAGFREILYFINASPEAQTLVLPEERGKAYVLHPVQASAQAADTRAKQARYDAKKGRVHDSRTHGGGVCGAMKRS